MGFNIVLDLFLMRKDTSFHFTKKVKLDIYMLYNTKKTYSYREKERRLTDKI